MLKIPKQQFMAEFTELSVKRVKAGETVAVAARESGLVESDAAEPGQGGEGGKAHYARSEVGDPVADGVVAGPGSERAVADRARCRNIAAAYFARESP